MDFYVSSAHIKQLQAVVFGLVDENEYSEPSETDPGMRMAHWDRCRICVRSYGHKDLELGLAKAIGLSLFRDHLGNGHMTADQFQHMQRLHLDMVYLLEIILQQHPEETSFTKTRWKVDENGRVVMSNALTECLSEDVNWPINILTFGEPMTEFINNTQLKRGWWHKDEHNQWHHIEDSAQAEDVDVFGELRAVLASNRIDKYRLKQLLDEQEPGLLDYAIDCLVQRTNMPKPHLDGLLYLDPTKNFGRFDPTNPDASDEEPHYAM